MRVKERHRGEEELQEGCVSFRASEGRGKGATHLSCIRGEQAVVKRTDRHLATARKRKGRATRGVMEGRGGERQGAGKQMKRLILHPRSAAGGKPCSAGADVG